MNSALWVLLVTTGIGLCCLAWPRKPVQDCFGRTPRGGSEWHLSSYPKSAPSDQPAYWKSNCSIQIVRQTMNSQRNRLERQIWKRWFNTQASLGLSWKDHSKVNHYESIPQLISIYGPADSDETLVSGLCESTEKGNRFYWSNFNPSVTVFMSFRVHCASAKQKAVGFWRSEWRRHPKRRSSGAVRGLTR